MNEDSRTTPPVWPEGRAGAVSLTFDDGSSSQLRLAVPMLDEHELQGTFYLNPRGEDWAARLDPWVAVANAGHEIGNHSLRHICSRGHRDRLDGPSLEQLTLAELEEDILEAERRLQAAIPGNGPRSFCYPCYHTEIGEGATKQSYVPLIAKHFIAGRTRGEFCWNHPLTCDLHALWSQNCEGASSQEMIGLVELGIARGRWVIFTFHGIEQGNLAVAANHLRDLLVHLQRLRERIWTAPVATVAQRVVDWRRDTGALDRADRRA